MTDSTVSKQNPTKPNETMDQKKRDLLKKIGTAGLAIPTSLALMTAKADASL